jgi:hypothetical protein
MISRMLDRLGRVQLRLAHASYKALGFPAHPGYCPVCDRNVRRWLPLMRMVGDGKLRDEGEGRLCPHCYSYERTRHFWLFLEKDGLLKKGPRMLHFAPEFGLERRLRSALGSQLVTTDIEMPNVDVKGDITRLPFEAQAFDLIYCSNVLEHVPDDATAMRELHRVLAPGGLAVVQVPIRGDSTYENPAITTPEARVEHFGQSDHVRYYGRDMAVRLRDAGFVVDEVVMLDLLQLPSSEVARCNLNKREFIYFCRR